MSYNVQIQYYVTACTNAMHIHTHTHTYTYIHTHTHTYTHIHTQCDNVHKNQFNIFVNTIVVEQVYGRHQNQTCAAHRGWLSRFGSPRRTSGARAATLLHSCASLSAFRYLTSPRLSAESGGADVSSILVVTNAMTGAVTNTLIGVCPALNMARCTIWRVSGQPPS